MRYSLVLSLAGCLLVLQGCVVPMVAAGVGVGAEMSSSDRRTAGAMVEDESIENKSDQRIADKYKTDTHVNVTAFNRFVLISGEVSNETVKMDIERMVGSVPNVKGIANELVVAGVSSMGARSTDSRITSSVKMRFVKNKTFKADHIKVITESSVVYLLGLVTHAEADAASEIAATTRGVLKVVRVFDYID